MAEANNVVLKTAGESVLDESPVRKSSNHELLLSTSPDPVIDEPYAAPVVVAVVPALVGVVLLAGFLLYKI
ncbi:hypothetical protein V6N12_028642 [Hibiscus sabdariffa]|uniref:Uncharacterized protein n=1 Tax=Hibiscus sabdariffa TaxID=183260 RepID=A0ABR2F6F4_9ROSI